MKFEKIVNLLSERVIQAICNIHEKSDPELTFLLDPNWVDTCWKTMSEDERKVILFFMMVKGEDILTYRELEQTALPLSSARFRVALTKLRRLGFIFTIRRMLGEQAYIMSVEQNELFRRLQISGSSDWRSQKLLPDYTSYHMVEDLLQVLNVVRKSSIEFSKKGTLHKRSIKALFQETRITKEMFTSFAEGIPPLQPFEIHEAIVLDVLLEWDLLKKIGGKLVLGNVEKWVNQSLEELSNKLLRKIIRTRKLEPKLNMFFTLIQTIKKSYVYSLEVILSSMGDFAPTKEEVMEKCIGPLSKMGFLESKVEHGETIFKWKEYHEIPSCNVYVQPNFEIIMPAFSPLSQKWEFMQVASIQKREEMWAFKLEKDSCQFYFESGKTGSDLIKLLQQYSLGEIPENIITAIKHWEKDFEQVSLWDVRLLRVSHSELVKELERIPTIANLLYEKVGDRSFIVRVQDHKRLEEELEKRGYSTGPVINFISPIEEEGNSSIPLFKTKPDEEEYKVESVFPDLEDALPGLRQIPRMWISNFSKYHESTLRELIQQAIQLGLELRLESHGQSHQVCPFGMINKEGFWILITKDEEERKLEYSIEEIDKIQIICPI